MINKGQLIDGFEIVEKLPSGGMGDVYRAKVEDEVEVEVEDEDEVEAEVKAEAEAEVKEGDEGRGRYVALKFLRRPPPSPHRGEGWGEGEALYNKIAERFKAEYQILSRLKHPNIARVYKFGHYQGLFYFASEYIEGEKIYNASLGLPYDKVIKLYTQLLKGLDFLHRSGVVHLDIKPSNVLVTEVAGRPVVKIIDFGLSTAVSEYRGMVGGSIDYVAPEVVLGHKDKVDGRADLFSAAVLMYYCTNHVPPFDRYGAESDLERLKEIVKNEKPPTSPLKWVSDIPDYLKTIILRLLNSDPDERFYTNAHAVINALRTQSPDTFIGVSGNYLLPPHGKFIGQEKALKEIKTRLESPSPHASPPPNVGKIPISPPPSGGRIEVGGRGEGEISTTYTCTGERGFGKTHFLKIIQHEAELRADKWFTSSLSLPASSVEADNWLKDLQTKLSEGQRGVVILIDDLNHLDLCEEETHEKIKTVIDNLLNAISERQKRPELFENIPPIILLYSFLPAYNSSPLEGEDKGGGEKTPPPSGGRIKVGGHIHVIHLKPFGTKEIEQYLKSTPAFREKELPPGWVGKFWHVTKGIPGEVYEHLKKMDEDGVLFDPEGKLHLPSFPSPPVSPPPAGGRIKVGGMGEGEKPPPLTRERLIGEYQKLKPPEKQILNLISIWSWKGITRPITYEDIANFIYSPSLLQNIENLENNGILTRYLPLACPERSRRDGGGQAGVKGKKVGVIFANSYYPTIIYHHIPQEDRELIHDQIASYLKTDQDAIMLHRGYGGDKEAGLLNLVKLSKQRIWERGDLRLAAELLEDALKILNSRRDALGSTYQKLNSYISSMLIECFSNSGKYINAIETFNTALNAIDDGSRKSVGLRTWKVLLYIKAIPAYLQSGKYKDASSMTADALSLCRQENLPLYIALRNYEGRNFYERFHEKTGGDSKLLNDAKKIFEDTIRLEKKLPKTSQNRIQNNELGYILLTLGEYEQAITALKEKFRRHKKQKNIFGEISTAVAIANTFQLLKDYSGAEEFAKYALELSQRTNQGKWIMTARHILANIYHDSDNFNNSLQEINKCITLSPCVKTREIIINQLWVQIGDCYKELKQWDKAIMYFESALGAKVGGYYLMWAHEGLGEVYYNIKKFDEATKHLSESEILLSSIPNVIAAPYIKRIRDLKTRIAQKTSSK